MPVFNYIANYEYISQELCENKDKPELECNGKCYLIKQTRALQEEQEEKEAVISEVLNLQYTTSDSFSYELLSFIDVERINIFPYSEKEYSVISDLITPPPRSFV
ncbi:MAG: hypothetical protein KAG37_11930 [Flavobacteriales bacterium]|nr:hypothetical protein [Flavobacteriales bacterium]